MTSITSIKVPSQTEPMRLDKFLIQRFPHTSRNFWNEHLEASVFLNGRHPKKSQCIEGGETLEIPTNLLTKKKFQPDFSLSIPLIHEDPHFLVVEKPAGMPIHPLESEEKGTLIQGLWAQFPEVQKVGEDAREAGLVHRLDTGTSGLVLIARDNATQKFFREEFQKHRIEKEYLAVVEGHPFESTENFMERCIDLPIGHNPKNMKKMRIEPITAPSKKQKGRSAVTFVSLEKSFQNHSLLKIRIPTGVRHQIRVHLAHKNLPIVGDELYGGFAVKSSGFDRFFLHASRLKFRDPQTLEYHEFTSPLPEEFSRLLNSKTRL